MKVERYFSVADMRQDVFPGRSLRWITDRIKDGSFGDVARDGGGWLVPESGVLAYLERHRVAVKAMQAHAQAANANLLQFQTAEA